MSRQRRGRRKPNSSNKNQSGEGNIPSSHKSSGRKNRNNSKRKNRNPNNKRSKNPKNSGEFKSVAPSPLLALHRIKSSSPVGTGLNPLAGEFLNAKNDKKLKEPTFFKVVFFNTFKEAKESAESIKENCNGCDQLNVVIKAEGDMDDKELLSIHEKVKVFAGEAWTLIHSRRSEDGWYESAQ